jgi:hypothetical protein
MRRKRAFAVDSVVVGLAKDKDVVPSTNGVLRMIRIFQLLPVALLAVAFQSVSAQDKKEPEKLEFAGGKIVAIKPEAWKTVPPKAAGITKYEFRVPAEGEKFARITISESGGGIGPNIDRWIGQFEGVKKEEVKVEKKEVDQTTIHMVEINGTFKESMGGGPFAPGPMKKMENYKMLGAILELKTGGTTFVKATGPNDIVAGIKDDWTKMLEGIKNK